MIDITHLHPMITHFPIALIIVGFAADFFSLFIRKEVCLSRTGLYLEVLGALGAIAAVATGYFLTGENLENAGHTGVLHETYAFCTLGSILVAVLVRIFIVAKKKEQTNLNFLALSLFFISFVFVSITGFFGGLVVFGNS